jgi:hypothetical protein
MHIDFDGMESMLQMLAFAIEEGIYKNVFWF